MRKNLFSGIIESYQLGSLLLTLPEFGVVSPRNDEGTVEKHFIFLSRDTIPPVSSPLTSQTGEEGEEEEEGEGGRGSQKDGGGGGGRAVEEEEEGAKERSVCFLFCTRVRRMDGFVRWWWWGGYRPKG